MYNKELKANTNDENITNKMSVYEDNTNNKFLELCKYIRDDVRNNPYIQETLRVLPVGGYRSAIGSFWNAVVDDLRNKILYRSIELFNKEMNQNIKSYDDFQDKVNDEILIDGAYRIGIISWEAHKVLKHAKETRHIFDGHPKSSEPGPIKVLSMMADCIKYVLSQDYPPQIVNIDDYINIMGKSEFDRNEYSISETISNLPDEYKNQLINRFFSSYINEDCSSILRSNIEFVAPILWKELSKDTMVQISKRVDKEIAKANTTRINYVFSFINIVDSKKYLTNRAKKHIIAPIIKKLTNNLDNFNEENHCVAELSKYAGFIPRELLFEYVNALTQTYVGYVGGSYYFSRTDFYADGAALKIPTMFETFDDESAYAFIKTIKTNTLLQNRITKKVKLDRLRALGHIVYKKISDNFDETEFLELLLNEEKEKLFFDALSNRK